jgi:deoxyribonuclease (pyrimidine dimer)
MTRINVGIPPSELTDKHLIAEAREIKRIPNCVAKGRFKLDGQPKQFKLGTGHVKFFYDKLGYLLKRYEQLYLECIKRKFNVQNYSNAWDNVPEHLMGDYTPTKKDVQLVRERILFNASERPIHAS